MEIDCVGAVACVFQNPDMASRFYFFPAFKACIVFIKNNVFSYLYIKLAVFLPAFPACFTKPAAFIVISIYPAQNSVKVQGIPGIFNILNWEPQI